MIFKWRKRSVPDICQWQTYFAFLPTRVTEDDIIWLGWYEARLDWSNGAWALWSYRHSQPLESANPNPVENKEVSAA